MKRILTIDLSDRDDVLRTISYLYSQLAAQHPSPEFEEEDRLLMAKDLEDYDPWSEPCTADTSFRATFNNKELHNAR
jgi:molybdopterin converting factor small subunit